MNARHLYIHVPFCSRRCSYCDFSIAVRSRTPVNEYLDALTREIENLDQNTDTLETVYAGGGTPSRLGAAGIERMLAAVRENFRAANDAEITLEANPEDVTPGAAKAWREAGVNRISLGVQSFDDSVLQWMHRVHDSSQSRNAIRTLRDAGFENISLDLIFALPGSLGRSWERDLDLAIEESPEHVSLYGLTVEQHTPLAKWEARGDFIRTEDDEYADEFLLAHRTMTAAGFEHYEVSNFGKPGKRSMHNSAYWTGAPYRGIGPSAHSFDCDSRWWNARNYVDWIDRVKQGASPVVERENLDRDKISAERIYLGLRTDRGLPATDRELETAGDWVRAGWATIDGRVIRLNEEGWLRLDSLAAQLTVP